MTSTLMGVRGRQCLRSDTSIIYTVSVKSDLNNEIYELIRECNVNNYHNITIYL